MSSTDRQAGFTLLEMMAVMLIIALVSALVIAATPGTGRARLKAVTMDTAALLRRERTSAILASHTTRVWLDSGRRMLMGDGGYRVAIPNDVVVDLLGVDAFWQNGRAVARFEPDGTSSGAVLKYSREEARYEIRVNWYTGGVAILAVPPQ
ncbi:MAG TPA: prepilin-type N-terminal cleavage/methylation domain-containing protein [Xanthobacteraceae bacterium]|nr:prepilin-type N-terminal cleavage/methylation domain-containing protein [Xanthobacteraceae bacterium]